MAAGRSAGEDQNQGGRADVPLVCRKEGGGERRGLVR